MFPASRPSRGVVSCVALGLAGHPPKGVVPRYPPRGVLRDWARPVPGSCRGVLSPLTGGFAQQVCIIGLVFFRNLSISENMYPLYQSAIYSRKPLVCTHHTRSSRRGRTPYAWFGLLINWVAKPRDMLPLTN